jgi:cell division protein FtsL
MPIGIFMANKRKNKSRQSKKFKQIILWKRKHKVLFLLAIVVLIVIGFLLYRQANILHERQQFKTGEKTVSEIMSQLTAELGESEADIYRQCSYGTIKLAKKNLGCSFEYYISYKVSSPAEASNKAQRANEIISNTPSISFRSTDTIRFLDEDDKLSTLKSKDSIYGIDIEGANFLRCGVTLGYGKEIKHESQRVISVAIKCSSKENVTTNYYPMVN